MRKISPPPGFDPRTVQPVASSYTDYAIPAHTQTYTHTHTHTHTYIYIYIYSNLLHGIWIILKRYAAIVICTLPSNINITKRVNLSSKILNLSKK